MIWIAGLVVLFMQPYYKVLGYVALAAVALNVALAAVLPQTAALRLVDTVITLVIFLAVGAAIVAVRKWMKNRRPKGDKQLDAEMDRIRAEIAAREGQPPAASN